MSSEPKAAAPKPSQGVIHRHRLTVVAGILGLVIGVLLAVLINQNQSQRTATAGLFNVDEKTAAVKLTTHGGKVITWASFSGEKRLVYFGYTFCPDVCPTELAKMAGVANQLEQKGSTLRQLFLTVDPERDTPEVLKKYVPYFHSSLTGLHTEGEHLKKLAAAFKVFYNKSAKSEEDSYYLMEHTSSIFFVSEDGEVKNIFDATYSVDQIVEQILKSL